MNRYVAGTTGLIRVAFLGISLPLCGFSSAMTSSIPQELKNFLPDRTRYTVFERKHTAERYIKPGCMLYYYHRLLIYFRCQVKFLFFLLHDAP